MDTTVVITPRERFSILPRSLRSLLASIPNDVPVILIDAGAPEHIRREIRKIKAERFFTHIESDRFLLAPRVRNMALAMVETKYVCYADNDVIYTDSEGWLERLESCAERTGAAAVSPITLFGPLPQKPIHQAGSLLSVIEDKSGCRLLHSEHRLEWKSLDEARANNWFNITMECHEFEYHCALINADHMREIGGHDERQTHHDHINDSLRLRILGHKIMLEPEATVTYAALTPFSNEDWPYFLFRWSDYNTILSQATLGEVWGLRKSPVERELDFVTMHRRRAAATTLPKWIKKIRPKGVQKRLRELLLDFRQWQISRFDLRLSDLGDRYVAPPCPENGLKLARIPGA